jgi:hypothetical protein
LFWAILFHIGFHKGIANSHKYLSLTRRFDETISIRAGPPAPYITKPMSFGILIKAFGSVIEESRAKSHLPS